MPLLAEGEGTEEGSLLDQIWPKKEGLTLIKWSVASSLFASCPSSVSGRDGGQSSNLLPVGRSANLLSLLGSLVRRQQQAATARPASTVLTYFAMKLY